MTEGLTHAVAVPRARLPADAPQRERAADPRRSVVLQAPAGSGKTTVLTERFLRVLAEVEQPEEILAITFTRRAAGEMRARVLRALRGEVGPGSQGERMRVLAAAALRRDAACGWNLAQDPGRLRIQTIDAFNFRLATQLTVGAKAGGALVITQRPEELYAEAARRTLSSAGEDEQQLGADVELLFERLDNHWQNLQRLLADMLCERGHWLRHVLAHEPGGLCARIGQSLEHVVREQLATTYALLSPALGSRMFPSSVGNLSGDPACLPGWKRLASLALTVKGEWRKPTGINRSLGAEYEAAAQREALSALIERMSQVAGFREALAEAAALPPPALGSDDAAAVEALTRVLRFAAGQLHVQFASVGRVDHTYVAGAAREALTEGGLPTDLALRMGLSLRHILVDEFQDTSLAQFELIEALTVGWEEGDGRTLFVVGDPMQSIYQFREAEVGLFLRARDRGIGSLRLEPLQLTHNFRSSPPLIAWINAAFSRLYPVQDDLRASAVSFTPSVAGVVGGLDEEAAEESPTDSGVVQVRVFDDGDREAETAAISQRILELRSLEPEATLAVLVASRAHAVPIMLDLEQRAVEAVGVDLVPLSELPIVRDLVALLRATSHLGDRTSWLALLRAPWCGVSLASLTVLSGREDSLLVWEAMADATRLAACAPEDRVRLERVRQVIATALASRNSLPPADWLELTWTRLGAADAYAEPELRHARAFFTALSERVAAGEWAGPQDLDSLLGRLFAQPQASCANPVQVMTIHRAKGLEFDHVFVPSLDRDLNRGRAPLLRWLDLPREAGESDLIMAPVPAVGDDAASEVNTYLKRLCARRAANERTRLLYVAATRARKSLFLSAAPKPRADGAIVPRAGTLLATLWPAVAARPTAGREQATPPPAATNDRRPASPVASVLRRLKRDWSLPSIARGPELARLPLARKSLEPPEFSWVQETARHVGTVVHAALEHFSASAPLPTAAAIEAARADYADRLRRHGVPEGEVSGAAALVVEALVRTLRHERGRWILDPDHREPHSEWPLTGLAGGRLASVVIDRSFVDRDGTRWVVDFKTSQHRGGGREAFLAQELERYRAQLEVYRELASRLGPEPVRAALYFPLLEAFCELDPS